MLRSQGLAADGRAPSLTADSDRLGALAAGVGHVASAGRMRAAFLPSAPLIALALPLVLRR